MTSTQHTPGGIETNSRGIAVLVVAVVVGFLLLLNAGGGAASSSDGDDSAVPPPDTSGLVDDGSSTTSQPEDLAGTTTTSAPDDEARDPGDVTVAVLNGGGPTGAAAAASNTVVSAGWKKGSVGNVPAANHLDTTTIYFREGFQPEASAVAALLGKAADSVQAMPDQKIGEEADTDNVIVVLGRDTPPVSGAGATTTTAG